MATEAVTLEVYDPTGAIEVSQLFAPRPVNLHGKIIGELWNGSWAGDRTFPLIRELIQRQFPTAKIIPYSEFPVGNATIDVDDIGDVLKRKGCQAVIVGNAA